MFNLSKLSIIQLFFIVYIDNLNMHSIMYPLEDPQLVNK